MTTVWQPGIRPWGARLAVDEAKARDLDFHRTAIRTGLVSCEYRMVYGRRSVVTWNAARDAFTVESLVARDSTWIAGDLAAKYGLKISPLAQLFNRHGMTVSQYLVVGETGREAA